MTNDALFTPAPLGVAQTGDFVELRQDVSASPLWNRDLAPTTITERVWSTWNIAALWIGMSIVITTYELAGGMIASGMTWWQAMLTILLGNTIVLIPMTLNAHAGTKYGVSFPVLLRASFGTKGANFAAMARALVACGWFGIQTWIAGTALDVCVGKLVGGWPSTPEGTIAWHTWVAFFAFWGFQVFFIIRGIEGVRKLESYSAPLRVAAGAALLIWATSKAGGLGEVLGRVKPTGTGAPNFWAIFPANLTASVGYWATLSLNIPDFTRFARSQKSQMTGQALGLPTTMTAAAFIGVAVTSATGLIYGKPIPHLVDLVQQFSSVWVVLFATFIIFLSQLSCNMAANVVSPSNDFSNLNPKRISYVMGGFITAGIGVLMMPWKLLAAGGYIFTWLIGYSALMGAIAGIMICDYWVMRRARLDLAALFDPQGCYSYTNGWNWRALVAFCVAVAPCVPGFLHAAITEGGQVASPGLFDTLYTYAWFITFGLGALLYAVLMQGNPSLQEGYEPTLAPHTVADTA